MAALKKITIDIVSDTVCPFCYVGKRNLEKAMDQLKGRAEFEVVWHPYQLNPAAPKEGEPKLPFYHGKFGARVEAILDNMKRSFAAAGLAPFTTEGLIANTTDSHRLVEWALKTGGWQKQNTLMEELMRGYFTEARNYGDRAFLVEAAGRAGLDTQAADALLKDESAGMESLQAALSSAARARMSGVPDFTINKKIRLSGAQPPETFVEVLEGLLSS